jgi:hypothetical protein
VSVQIIRAEPVAPGKRPLRPRLDLLITVENTSGRWYVVQDARALVEMATPEGENRSVGSASAFGAQHHLDLSGDGGTATIRLAVFLDTATVQEMEDVRAGQDVVLVLHVVLVGVPLDGRITGFPGLRIELPATVRIPEPAWVERFLPALGFPVLSSVARPSVGRMPANDREVFSRTPSMSARVMPSGPLARPRGAS